MQKALVYLLAGFIYVIWPLDFPPDFLGVVGYVDDAMVAALSVYLAVQSLRKALAKRPGRRAGPQGMKMLNAHEILGVPRGASSGELKEAYRREMSKYHPDKVAHLGDELKRTAEERCKLIARAYEELSGK